MVLGNTCFGVRRSALDCCSRWLLRNLGLRAKVYKLVDGKYDKQGDFSQETYVFEDTLCKEGVDFNKEFKHFRK